MTSTRWVDLVFLIAFSGVVLAGYGPFEAPLLGDRAYFAYLGQMIARGEPIYAGTFIGYPPTPFLVSGGAIRLGAWLGVSSEIAPRVVSMAVFVAAVLSSYGVARRALDSRIGGLFAAVALGSVGLLGSLGVSALEPKVLVVLGSLETARAVQRERWGLAGFASLLCASCWQPATLVPASAVLTLLWQLLGSKPGDRAASARAFALGAVAGLAPAVLYLSLTATGPEFWQRGFAIPAATQLPQAGHDPLRWLRILWLYYGSEIAIHFVAALGFVGFLFGSLRQRGNPLSTWLDTRWGSLPFLTLLWLAFVAFEFQGPPDWVPVLPVVALWFAMAIDGARRRVALPAAVWVGVLGGVAIYGAADAILYRPGVTLERERALVDSILEGVDANDTVLSFEATEVYVLSGRTAPVPFLSMNRYFLRFASIVDLDGCDGLRERVWSLAPRVVVIRMWSWQSQCVRGIGRALGKAGYRRRVIVLGERRHRSYVPDDTNLRVIRWHVYRRDPSH